MKDKVEDIKRAIESGAYLSALALALTLPDICSKIAYGKSEKQGYSKWFNEYVAPNYFPDFNAIEKIWGNTEEAPPGRSDWPVFDGAACYKLRCSVLHSGNVDIGSQKAIDIQHFELFVSGMDLPGCGPSLGRWVHSSPGEDDRIEKRMRIDVKNLCHALAQAAIEFYAKHDDKSAFEEHSIELRRF
ncbi:hypothetical protein [Raoultibacter massiliensis]|uniref:hypothetical protein n=1 Tax=Raoultibacter massiliensis TaxID=1852371 RepID=UPI003A90D25D